MQTNLIKRLFFLTLLLGSAVILEGQNTVAGLQRKARTQYSEGNYLAAIETYREVLTKRKDDAEALGNLAECLRLVNRLEEAAETYQTLVRSKKNTEIQLLNYAHTLKGLGKYDEAKVFYQNYARSNPAVGNQYAGSCDFAKNNSSLPSNFSVNNESINTANAEFGPAVASEQVVFSGFRGGTSNQLLTSVAGADGSLGNAAPLRQNATDFGMGPVSFSADGRLVAYTRNRYTNGVRQIPETITSMTIFLADVGFGGNWTNERPFPLNDPKSKTGYPCFTPDGKALFFASDRPGGLGGWDLYIAYFEGGTWSKPVNLGPTVNTSGDEIAPFFDGTNLYFSSDWQYGFGGFDIFMAEQGGGQWVKATNLGTPINSPRDDYGYVFDAFRNVGYFTSNRAGGRGLEDLYRVSTAAQNFQIRVVNGSDGRPLPNAAVDLASCLRGGVRNYSANTDARGILVFPVGAGTDCEIIVSLEGYLPNRVALAPLVAQGNREVEIALTRRGEEYFGNVNGADTQSPLVGAIVTARNNTNGAITRVQTNNSGTYVLGLANNTTYTLTFNAQGYREQSREVFTSNGTNKTILGLTSLTSINAFPPTTNPYPPANPNNPTNPSGGGSGWAVQLAALASAPNLDNFGALRSYGNVYAVFEGGKHKLRLGPFVSREEASRVLAAVKPQGYSGAFLVAESGGGTGTGAFNPPPANPNPNPFPPSNPGTARGRFHIQLGAYRAASSFNSSKLSGLGVVEDFPRGDLTIKLLCCFNSATDAQLTLPRVQQAGFPTAFVVELVNGQLVRVR